MNAATLAGIAVHCNLGLASSRCDVLARGQVIDPAAVWNYLPPGSGNLWVSVWMTDKR